MNDSFDAGFFTTCELVSFGNQRFVTCSISSRSHQKVLKSSKVRLSKQAKWNACVQMVKTDPSVLLVAWREETFLEIESVPVLRQSVIKADHLSYDKTVGRMVVFAEHYPLVPVEDTLYSKLQLKDVPVLSCLEEPLFMFFGGTESLKNLGLNEDEVIEHSMVTKAIRRAQEKIAGSRRVGTGTDYPATSPKSRLPSM